MVEEEVYTERHSEFNYRIGRLASNDLWIFIAYIIVVLVVRKFVEKTMCFMKAIYGQALNAKIQLKK